MSSAARPSIDIVTLLLLPPPFWSVGRRASYRRRLVRRRLLCTLSCLLGCLCGFSDCTRRYGRRRGGDARNADCCCPVAVKSAEHGGRGARTLQTGAGAALAAATAAAAAWSTRIQWTASPSGDENVEGIPRWFLYSLVHLLLQIRSRFGSLACSQENRVYSLHTVIHGLC